MTMARIVTTIDTVPAIARLPVEKIAPNRGVSRVTPQVGQPAPSAIRPAIIPAFSTLAELEDFDCSRFLFQSSTIMPMRVPCKMQIAKIGNQSRNGWLIPKIARNESRRIRRFSGKPSAPMSSNLAKPPESKLISMPKKIKLGTKPYQKRFSLVASNMPFPASANSSNHFLQFINSIITQVGA